MIKFLNYKKLRSHLYRPPTDWGQILIPVLRYVNLVYVMRNFPSFGKNIRKIFKKKTDSLFIPNNYRILTNDFLLKQGLRCAV